MHQANKAGEFVPPAGGKAKVASGFIPDVLRDVFGGSGGRRIGVAGVGVDDEANGIESAEFAEGAPARMHSLFAHCYHKSGMCV